ncbi:hypothetical protein PTKIN_Ptkin12aG0087000 [Pterospermum kingtungense]
MAYSRSVDDFEEMGARFCPKKPKEVQEWKLVKQSQKTSLKANLEDEVLENAVQNFVNDVEVSYDKGKDVLIKQETKVPTTYTLGLSTIMQAIRLRKRGSKSKKDKVQKSSSLSEELLSKSK